MARRTLLNGSSRLHSPAIAESAPLIALFLACLLYARKDAVAHKIVPVFVHALDNLIPLSALTLPVFP